MTIKLDLTTNKKLLLVKQLYQQAILQSSSENSVIKRIMAVIGFDLASETVLKAVVRALDTTVIFKGRFHELIDQVNRLLDDNGMSHIEDKANIKDVHKLRNLAQHEVRSPNVNEVNDCRTYTRDFLRKIVLKVWDVDFNNIRLSNNIQNSKIRDFLLKSEEAFKNGEYSESVKYAAGGLSLSLISVKKAIVGGVPRRPINTASFTRPSGRPLGSTHFSEPEHTQSRYEEDLNKVMKRMQETLLYIGLGMNYSEYMNYKKIVGDISFSVGSTEPIMYGNKKPLDRDDAEYVISYCSEAIVQIESVVGDLKKPFGKVHWY